jgi:hypothetical protein
VGLGRRGRLAGVSGFALRGGCVGRK